MEAKIQTIHDIRRLLNSQLRDIVEESELDPHITVILRHILRIEGMYGIMTYDKPVTEKETQKALEICREIRSGRPIQYVLGETHFYNCTIRLHGHELIPRPETEELVDCVIKENKGFTGSIVDIGTGSGCIAVALASNLPRAAITGVDISEDALNTAIENSELNKVKISFIRGDILDRSFSTGEPAGIIVSNPPYVMEKEKAQMSHRVLDHEPPGALFVPDSDPLLFYRAILRFASHSLVPGGKVYFEINESLGKEMITILDSAGFKNIELVKDINSKDRIVKALKNA